jgi:hypothetical protein
MYMHSGNRALPAVISNIPKAGFMPSGETRDFLSQDPGKSVHLSLFKVESTGWWC